MELPWWVWSFVALAVVHVCGQRNIAFSGAILGVCMIAEIAILLLLDLGIVFSGGGPEGFTATSFAPATVFAPGLGVALVFVVGSFIGFEATAIFGEEAENPEKTIPRATYLAVLLITVFYAFSTWAIVQFYGAAAIQPTAAGGLETLYFAASDQVLGAWSSQVMNILLITSLFACVLSFHNTLNRYFFALGREGLAFRLLGKVHAVHGSPYIAGMLQTGLAFTVLVLFIVSGADPYTVVFSWMSALAVIGILAVQALVTVAIILFFRKENFGYSPLKTLVAPVLALIGLLGALFLVISNLALLSGSESLIVKSFPYLIALVGLLVQPSPCRSRRCVRSSMPRSGGLSNDRDQPTDPVRPAARRNADPAHRRDPDRGRREPSPVFDLLHPWGPHDRNRDLLRQGLRSCGSGRPAARSAPPIDIICFA